MQRSAVVSEPDSTYTPWGTLAAIDLHGCGFEALSDPDRIRAFGGTPTLRVLRR